MRFLNTSIIIMYILILYIMYVQYNIYKTERTKDDRQHRTDKNTIPNNIRSHDTLKILKIKEPPSIASHNQ